MAVQRKKENDTLFAENISEVSVNKTILNGSDTFWVIQQECNPKNDEIRYVKTTISLTCSPNAAKGVAEYLHENWMLPNKVSKKALNKVHWFSKNHNKKWTPSDGLTLECSINGDRRHIDIGENDLYSFIWQVGTYSIQWGAVNFEETIRVPYGKYEFEELKEKGAEKRKKWTLFYPNLEKIITKFVAQYPNYGDKSERLKSIDTVFDEIISEDNGNIENTANSQKKKGLKRWQWVLIILFIIVIIALL